MTKEETGKILAVINAYYPYFFKEMNAEGKRAIIELWARQFFDYDYAIVNAALDAYIAVDEQNRAPNVGMLKSLIRRMTQAEEMTEQEAWGLVAQALRNSNYNAAEEFERLPEQIKRVVGSPNQLREWATMDNDTLQSVVASNFQRSYRAKAKSDKEYQAIPASVRETIAQLTQGMPVLKQIEGSE